MENFKIVHNVQTNEIEEIALTSADITQKTKDLAESEAQAKLIADQKNAKSDLLAKLGITEDEARLLLG